MSTKVKKKNNNNLGIEQDADGIKIEDIMNNKTALKMLLNDYTKIENENVMLKQDLNRQATIEKSLDKKKINSKVASITSVVSTIALGFGINFLTNDISNFAGWIIFVIGVVLYVISTYYSLKEVNEDV